MQQKWYCYKWSLCWVITWKLVFGEGHFFGVGNSAAERAQSTGFLQMVGLGDGLGQSMHGGGNKQDESKGNIFGIMGNTEGRIHRNNSTEHRFKYGIINSNELFQIGCDYETENIHHR